MLVPLKSLLEPCKTWNPINSPDAEFQYIDISSVDRENKKITSTTLLNGQDAPSRARQIVKSGDVLVSTVRPNLNSVAQVRADLDGATASTGFTVLRPRSTLDSAYLFHWVRTPQFIDDMVKKATGANYPAVSDRIIFESTIPLPDIAEQRRIAAILDKAEALRSKRREAIAKLDQLLQSVFLEMFGRSIEGSNGWGNASLSDYGNFKNGLNFEKNESGEKVKYLGVGDFKDRSRFDNICSLSKIDLNTLPTSDYFLKNGDLLFVRSNGNRELVGRCMEVYPENEIVTYSGFCIRYRIDSNLLISSYLVHLFRTKSVRNKLLQGGQGANIQNINQKTLSNLLIPIPPIELQNKWNDFLKKVNIQKNKLLDGNKKQNSLLISLQNNFFN